MKSKAVIAGYLLLSILFAAAIILADKLLPSGSFSDATRNWIVVGWVLGNSLLLAWVTRRLTAD